MANEEIAPPMEVTDWEQIGQKIELKHGGTGEVPEEFTKMYELVKEARLVLVQVTDGSALAAFKYFYENIIHSGGYAVPVLGATTPYDIVEHKNVIGPKSAVWVTSAPAEDKWINEKFNVIKPTSLFEVTSFIKTLSGKAEEHVCFVSDVMDEIYDIVSEKEFHTFLSRLHVLLKSGKHTLMLVADADLYTKEYLALLERYADVKIVFGETIELQDFRTNKKQKIK